MKETVVTAATQAAGILAGALGYHLQRNAPAVKKKVIGGPLVCYDSVTLDNLPEGGDAYLAYVTGWEQVTPSMVRARFPKAKIVSVSISPSFVAQILDVEKGAATVQNIPRWYHMCRDYGVKVPGVYASLSNMPSVEATFKANGIKRKDYLLFVADWDGVASIPHGYNAKQYKSTPTYDVSVLGRRAFG